MAKQPSAVIIARHGFRIDQADQSWRTNNADTAYDPPLTYGGWIQCQMLGSRISTELDGLDASAKTAAASEDSSGKSPRPRKRRRIIIHTSPYLRCVQTAVAIAAGLNQAQNNNRLAPIPTKSPLSRPRPARNSSPIPEETKEEPEVVSPGRSDSPPVSQNERPLLRLDSFLGEWLSPDYFETHVRPPPSEELVQRAKEYLRRPAETIHGADMASPLVPDIGSVDWDEKEKEMAAAPLHDKTGLRAMAASGQIPMKSSRHFSFAMGPTGRLALYNRIGKLAQTAYHPPVPRYALATQDPIPVGFVAHARDACVDIDASWDSEQSPLFWGNGGPFDEEWAGMHRRFRNGLEKMLQYYGEDLVSRGGEHDDDEDVVLVLVTHQAGCNALIRLMTGAPALHDVGTSSLTLAGRKPVEEGMSPIRRTASRRRGSLDIGIADEYDMKIIASTEHLRAGSNPLGLNSPRLGLSPAFASKRAVGPDAPEGFFLDEPRSRRTNSSGSTRRMRSQSQWQDSHISDEFPTAALSGLWSAWRHDASSSSNTSETANYSHNTTHPDTDTTDHTNESIDDIKSASINKGDGSQGDVARPSGNEPTAPATRRVCANGTPVLRNSNTWSASAMPVRSSSQRATGLWGSLI